MEGSDGLSKLLISQPLLGSTPFEKFAGMGSASTNAAPTSLLLKSLLGVKIRRLFYVRPEANRTAIDHVFVGGRVYSPNNFVQKDLGFSFVGWLCLLCSMLVVGRSKKIPLSSIPIGN